jgi:exonuclease SbcC
MEPGHAEAQRAAQHGELSADAAGRRLRDKEQELARAQSGQAGADAWLAQNARLRPLAESWQRWDTLFAQAQQQAEQHAAAAAACDAGATRLQQALAAERAAATALEQANGAHRQALDVRDAAAQQLRELEARDFPGARQALHMERERLADAERLWSAVAEGELRLSGLRAELQRHAQAAAEAGAQLRAAEQAQPALDAALIQS